MVSQPDYKGLDMDEWMLEELVSELRARGVEQLCINGHGETTARKGWHERFEPLASEFKVSLITNLARRLEVREIDFLSRIDSVNVSLDTADQHLSRAVRRSLDLDVLVRNLLDIRATADRHRRPGPRLVLYTGVYDKNVSHLESLARFAVTHGFSRVVFWSPVKHPDVPGVLNVRNLRSLRHEDQRGACEAIESALEILELNDISHEFVGDFFEVFKHEIDRPPREGPAGADANRIFVPAGAGVTKDCFDPWNYSQIKANGEVYPCCAHGPIGQIDGQHRYTDVLNGAKLKTLRQRLLTGDLDDECRHCHMRANIPIAEFQARYLNTFNASGHDTAPIAVPPWQLARTHAADRRWSVRATLLTLRSIARRARLGVWRNVRGHLDSPAAGPVWSRQLVVSGWCFSPKGVPVTGRVFVDGIHCADLKQNRARADVQRTFARGKAPLVSGFAERIRLPDSIQPGQRFSLWIELDAPGRRGRRLGRREMVLSERTDH
jgi:radical SAM protein with 4Fe4S-binding SPASM domain